MFLITFSVDIFNNPRFLSNIGCFAISGSSGVSMAERALIRVQQKLNGIQDGLVMSVPEQVSVLIQQATDQNNLSQVFNGWQPYF